MESWNSTSYFLLAISHQAPCKPLLYKGKMKNSLENSVSITSPWLSPDITSINTLQKILEISRELLNLPTTSEAGFECHLGKSGDRTDFCICLSPPSKDRQLWSEKIKSIQYFSGDSPIWRSIESFINSWNLEQSILHQKVRNAWLEFDINDSDKDTPTPSFFFSPNGINGGYHKDTPWKTPESFEWVIDNALEPLMQESLEDATKQRLRKCFQLLPDKGNVFQIGIMLPRPSESQSVRICISGIETLEIPNYLKSIECLECTKEIDSILNEIAGFIDRPAVSISIKDSVYPKIGIECYINDNTKHSPKWQAFLEFLVQHKLCTAQEMNALINWIGYSEEKSCSDIWPDDVRLGASFLYPTFRSTIVRTLHHIKIVYEPGKPLSAKAYLWFAHRWLAADGTLGV